MSSDNKVTNWLKKQDWKFFVLLILVGILGFFFWQEKTSDQTFLRNYNKQIENTHQSLEQMSELLEHQRNEMLRIEQEHELAIKEIKDEYNKAIQDLQSRTQQRRRTIISSTSNNPNEMARILSNATGLPVRER